MELNELFNELSEALPKRPKTDAIGATVIGGSGGGYLVKLDGSPLVIKARSNGTEAKAGDRVTVSLADHMATVNALFTEGVASDSAERLEALEELLGDAEGQQEADAQDMAEQLEAQDVRRGVRIVNDGVNVMDGEKLLAHFGPQTLIGDKDGGVYIDKDGVLIYKDGEKVARFGQRYVTRGMMQELVSVGVIESVNGGGVYVPELWADYAQCGFSNDDVDELNLSAFGESRFYGNVKLVPDPARPASYEGFSNVIETVSGTIASSSISAGSSNTKSTGTQLRAYAGYKVIGTPRHRFPDQVAWLDRGVSVSYADGYPVITFYIRNMGSSATSSQVTYQVDLIK